MWLMWPSASLPICATRAFRRFFTARSAFTVISNRGLNSGPSMGPKNHFTFFGFPLNIWCAMPMFWQRLTKEARGMGPSSRGSSIAHSPIRARVFISSYTLSPTM